GMDGEPALRSQEHVLAPRNDALDQLSREIRRSERGHPKIGRDQSLSAEGGIELRCREVDGVPFSHLTRPLSLSVSILWWRDGTPPRRGPRQLECRRSAHRPRVLR